MRVYYMFYQPTGKYLVYTYRFNILMYLLQTNAIREIDMKY